MGATDVAGAVRIRIEKANRDKVFAGQVAHFKDRAAAEYIRQQISDTVNSADTAVHETIWLAIHRSIRKTKGAHE